jgi:hypothetical protein
MTVATMKSNTWNFTCKSCVILRNTLIAVWVGFLAFGESAGRARAAAELSRQGFHKEARALMLESK